MNELYKEFDSALIMINMMVNGGWITKKEAEEQRKELGPVFLLHQRDKLTSQAIDRHECLESKKKRILEERTKEAEKNFEKFFGL